MKPEGFKHEPKICPRCCRVFECKVGSVEQCQCVAIKIDDRVQDFVQKKFADCLCVTCLLEISNEYNMNFYNSRLKD